mmetsp:Transcript_13037/g.15300  ORF Transcript_13037/g.15300 Transcript_13037/m.15300 type:complete len:238 (+) Transcript_13037:142-855(+)
MMEEPPQLQSILRSESVSSQEAHTILAQFLTAQKIFLASFQNNPHNNNNNNINNINNNSGIPIKSDEYGALDDTNEDGAILDESTVLITAREMTARLKGVLSCLATTTATASAGGTTVGTNTNTNDANGELPIVRDESPKRTTMVLKREDIEDEVPTNAGEDSTNEQQVIDVTTPLVDVADSKEKRSEARAERRRIKNEQKELKKDKKRKASRRKDDDKVSKRMKKAKMEDGGADGS